jgi:hypothetical protein
MAPEYRFSHTLLQTIVNCQEKIGPQKVWELLTESGRVNRQISSDHPERFLYCILINCNLYSISHEERIIEEINSYGVFRKHILNVLAI